MEFSIQRGMGADDSVLSGAVADSMDAAARAVARVVTGGSTVLNACELPAVEAVARSNVPQYGRALDFVC